jgi:hypothetical protein
MEAETDIDMQKEIFERLLCSSGTNDLSSSLLMIQLLRAFLQGSNDDLFGTIEEATVNLDESILLEKPVTDTCYEEQKRYLRSVETKKQPKRRCRSQSRRDARSDGEPEKGTF